MLPEEVFGKGPAPLPLPLLRARLCSGFAVRAGWGAAVGGLWFTWLVGLDLQLWRAG